MADSTPAPAGLNRSVLAAILGIGLLGACLEALTRSMDPRNLSQQAYSPDAITGYRLTPRPSDAPGPPINEEGIRTRPVPATRAPGEVRVLCLGDSMTGGGSMTVGGSWPDQLQERLAVGSTHPVRVINAGIEGYSIHQMALLMDELAPKYQPDLVILMYQDPGHGIAVPAPPEQRWRFALYNMAFRSAFVRAALLAATGSESFGNLPGLIRAELAHDPGGAAVTNLSGIAERARASGSAILFVQAPVSPVHAGEVGRQPLPDVREALESLPPEVPILWSDAAPDFTSHGAEAWSAEDWQHLTRAGNGALADAIAAEVRRRGLLVAGGAHG